MVLFIDPPYWPAHGTVWSHLVSDFSYEELHLFARSTGLPRRAFDLDHYDVPAQRYHDLVAAGATPVEGRELLARLRASGLRVPHPSRPAETRRRVLPELRAGWVDLAQEVAEPGDAGWTALGEDLVRRWSEPHRRYHDPTHLHAVLLDLDHLAHLGEPVAVEARLAAWFHDAVYEGEPGRDEERSAELAASGLAGAGLSDALAGRVAGLVLATAPGAPRDDDASARALVDADLAILAAAPKRYAAYVAGVRAEYAHVADGDFRRGRTLVLERLLGESVLYRTPTGLRLWEERARDNIAREVERLQRPDR